MVILVLLMSLRSSVKNKIACGNLFKERNVDYKNIYQENKERKHNKNCIYIVADWTSS
jgi:hypothetical protein